MPARGMHHLSASAGLPPTAETHRTLRQESTPTARLRRRQPDRHGGSAAQLVSEHVATGESHKLSGALLAEPDRALQRSGL